MFFNKNLKFLMKINNLNNNQLASKLGITRQSITDLVKTLDPRASTVIKLSNIFNVSIDDLLLKDLEEESK